jgi:hypothetical protein
LDGRRAEVLVALENGQQVWVPLTPLIRQDEGRYFVPLVLPIMVEALDVHKLPVETGRVRIHTTMHAREVLVDEPLLREEVLIARVPSTVWWRDPSLCAIRGRP